MKTVLKLGTILALTALVMIACKVVNNENNSANTLTSAKFESGEISGWVYDESENPQGFVKYTASDMVVQVNGGANEYIEKGMSEGFRQMLKKGDVQTYRSWVMDFGTEANARAMYKSMYDKWVSDREPASSYNMENQAFVRPTQTGYDGYAVFGKHMVWIQLDGYGTNLSEGKSKTIEFLQTIEQKFKELGLVS